MITIDPGIKTGWARFDDELADDGVPVKLVSCGLWDLDGAGYVGHVERAPVTYDAHTVIEDQVIYPKSKVRPNDIVKLAQTAGRIAERRGWHHCEWVEPRKWKGTLDKDAMHVRIVRALDEDERRVYFAAADAVAESYRHNIADAIGIGLHKLGRLSPCRLARVAKKRSR